MSKPFAYWVRLALVATLCTLTTFSPVLAGRWMDRLLHRDACNVVADGCEPAACAPMTVAEPCILESMPSVSCAPSAPVCGCPEISAAPSAAAPMVTPSAPEAHSQPAPTAPAPTTPAPQAEPSIPKQAEPTPAVVAPEATKPAPIVPAAPAPEVTSPFPAAPPKTEVVPPVEPAPAVVEPKVETPMPVVPQAAIPEVPATPAPVDPPKADPTDLFGNPEPAAPVPETPALETPAPAKEAPAKEEPAVIDLFNDPAPAPKAEPAVVPAQPAPAEGQALEDLFNPKPAEAAPKAAEPAPEKADDIGSLFGKPVATTTSDTPAASGGNQPSNTTFFENLFGSATDESKKATAPVAKEPAIDPVTQPAVINEPTPPKAVEGDMLNLEQLLGQPAKAATPANPKAVEPVAPVETKKDIAAPKESAPSEPAKSDAQPELDLDKLFGVGSFVPPPSFNGAEFRQWVDNTGAYSIKARLSVIYIDKIKLLKENGKFTTVPLSRLSERDFGYVQWVANNLTGEQTSMMVKKEMAPADSDSTR